MVNIETIINTGNSKKYKCFFLLFAVIFLISCTNSDYSGIPGKRTFKDFPLTFSAKGKK